VGRRAAAAALSALALVAAAGCGGNDSPAGNTTAMTEPTPTLPTGGDSSSETQRVTTPETGGATAPSTPPTATTGVPASGGTAAPSEEQAAPGGAGDEEAVRVPAAFSVTADGIVPAVVTVPAFLAVEVRLTAKDGRPHEVTVGTPGGDTVTVAAGGTAVLRVAGLQPGSYPLTADGGRVRGTLQVTRESPGP
jgi:hypothetical protein